MELKCFFRKFSLHTAGKFVFRGGANTPPPAPEAGDDGKRDGKNGRKEPDPRQRARDFLSSAGKFLGDVGGAIGQTFDDYGEGAKEAGRVAAGTVAGMPEAAADYGRGALRGVKAAGEVAAGTAREVPGVVADAAGAVAEKSGELGREYVAGPAGAYGADVAEAGRGTVELAQAGAAHVGEKAKAAASTVAAAGREYVTGPAGLAANDAWETAKPVAEVVAGLGLLTKDAIAAVGGDLKDWTDDQLIAAVDWTKFQGRYVRDGVVNAGRVAKEWGLEQKAVMAQLAAETYADAVATGKNIVKVGQYYVDITTDKGREMAEEYVVGPAVAYGRDVKEAGRATGEMAAEGARAAASAVASAGREYVTEPAKLALSDAWETTKPVAETLAGLGLLAKDQVAEWNREATTFAVKELVAAINWTVFAKRYVEKGVVNVAKATKEWGIGVGDFYAALAADTVDSARAAGKHLVVFAGKCVDITTAAGREYVTGPARLYRADASEAVTSATGAAKDILDRAGQRGGEAIGTRPLRIDEVVVRPSRPTREPPGVAAGGAPEALARPQVVEYTVKPGDSMTKITKEYYGTANVQFALALQKELLGTVERLSKGGKETDSLIREGQLLKLPAVFQGRERKKD